MKLYRSFNNHRTFLKEITSTQELGEAILADAATRFTYPSHDFVLDLKPGVVFAERRPDGLRYELEE